MDESKASTEFRETQLLKMLTSDYIIKFEDYFFDESKYFYLVLEFCQVLIVILKVIYLQIILMKKVFF